MSEQESKYEILYEDSAGALESAVNQKIAEGWKPQGGVAVVIYTWENEREGHTEHEWGWAQAVVRE